MMYTMMYDLKLLSRPMLNVNLLIIEWILTMQHYITPNKARFGDYLDYSIPDFNKNAQQIWSDLAS